MAAPAFVDRAASALAAFTSSPFGRELLSLEFCLRVFASAVVASLLYLAFGASPRAEPAAAARVRGAALTTSAHERAAPRADARRPAPPPPRRDPRARARAQAASLRGRTRAS